MNSEELAQRLAKRRICEAAHRSLRVPHNGFGWTGFRCSKCGFAFFEKWEAWADPLRALGQKLPPLRSANLSTWRAAMDHAEALKHLRVLINAASGLDDIELIYKHLRMMRKIVNDALPARRPKPAKKPKKSGLRLVK